MIARGMIDIKDIKDARQPILLPDSFSTQATAYADAITHAIEGVAMATAGPVDIQEILAGVMIACAVIILAGSHDPVDDAGAVASMLEHIVEMNARPTI